VTADTQTKPIDLGRESTENCELPSTSTIAIVIITQPKDTQWLQCFGAVGWAAGRASGL